MTQAYQTTESPESSCMRFYERAMSKHLARLEREEELRKEIRGMRPKHKNHSFHTPWNADEVETLMEMRRNGSTFQEIADELGRSFGSVLSRYHREEK